MNTNNNQEHIIKISCIKHFKVNSNNEINALNNTIKHINEKIDTTFFNETHAEIIENI